MKQIIVECLKGEIDKGLQEALDHFNKEGFDCIRLESFYENDFKVFFMMTLNPTEEVKVKEPNLKDLEKMFYTYDRCKSCRHYNEDSKTCTKYQELLPDKEPCPNFWLTKK